MEKRIEKNSFHEVLKQQMSQQLHDGLISMMLTKTAWLDRLLHLPLHTDFLGAFLIKKGQMKVDIKHQEHVFGPNTFITLSPLWITQIRSFSEDIEVHFLLLTFDLIKRLGLPFYKTYPIQSRQDNFGTVIPLTPTQASRCVLYFQNIAEQNVLTEKSLFQEEIIKTTLLLLFYELNALLRENFVYAPPGYENKSRIVMDFLFLISKYFRQDRSIQYYADKMFISRKHLTKVVKEVTGRGPKAILDDLVAAEAVLLLNSSLSIKDVMHALSFSDFSTFSRFFKNYLGKSPLTYRNEVIHRSH